MARKQKELSPRKIRKQEKKQRKAEDKAYEALRVKQNRESRRTGQPVPYDQRDKGDYRHSTQDQATYIKTNRPEQAEEKEYLRSRLRPAYDALRLPGDASTFGPIEQNALRNYSQKTVPGLAERFVGMNALDSSGFQQALQGGAGDLQTELADARARHGLEENRLESDNYWKALNSYQNPDIDTGFTPGHQSLFNKGATKALEYGADLAYDVAKTWATLGLNNGSTRGSKKGAASSPVTPQSQIRNIHAQNNGFTGANTRGFYTGGGMTTRDIAKAGYDNLI